MITHRTFLRTLGAATGAAAAIPALAAPGPFRLRYVLSSALYGETPLETILPEVSKAGCEAIDIWCRVHGNQREQIAEMGDEAFVALLEKNHTKLGVVSLFMHPTPRGVPILPATGEVTAAVNQSREYVEGCLKATA